MWFIDIISRIGQYAYGQANAAFVMLTDAVGVPLATNGGALNTFETAAMGYDPSIGRTAVEQSNNPIAAVFVNGTTAITIKAAPGFLHTLSLTVVGAPTATHLAVYDNTAGSGTVLAVLPLPAAGTPHNVVLDVLFSTGLTLVPATYTAGNTTPTAGALTNATTISVAGAYR